MSGNRQLFLRHLAQTSDIPLLLDIRRAEGLYLFDRAGKAYLDLIAGISVSILGHRHPAVVAAVKEQADHYLHTMVYGEFVLSPQVALAELLTRHMPPPLDRVYFVNSGSEATEGAMKLAKRYTGRPEVISCHRAYHGSTQGAASLMSPKTFTQAYHPLLPGIRHIRFGEPEDLRLIGERTACVIVETVQAESGVHPPPAGYLASLRERCRETGALLILDEIQVGFGRTGSLWAFSAHGIVPDVLLLAKGMGGGMPIGAFVAASEHMKCLGTDPPLGHITTFGGHPVSCAAAHATLQVLLESTLIPDVAAKEASFRRHLVHPDIRAVRSAGLLLAVELEGFDRLRRVMQYSLEQGMLVDWFLFNDRSLRLAPPLTIDEETIGQACAILLEALDRTR